MKTELKHDGRNPFFCRNNIAVNISQSFYLNLYIFNFQIEIFKRIKIKYRQIVPSLMTFSFTKKQTSKCTFEGL